MTKTTKFLKPVAQWGLLLGIAWLVFGYITDGIDDQPPPPKVRQVSLKPLEVSLEQTITELNDEFARHWQAEGVAPASQAAWETICRRMAVALVGSGLSVEEMRFLETVPEASRVEVCLQRLLRDERFADYWAERLARVFVGTEEGPFIVFRRRRFVDWLSEQIASQRPYNAMVRDLVMARGLWNDKPEVNFLTATIGEEDNAQPDPVILAMRTSRAFLGMRIDCLQCHDDFLGTMQLGSASEPRGGLQEDFHQLAAFYAPARNNGLQGIQDRGEDYKFQYLYADAEEVVPPQVPFADDLVDDRLPPRQRLASWLTHPENRQAARATVNRVWALMFGRPLHEPVDDIPLHGPLPPGLDRLADDFVQHGWDLRRLIAAIALSDVYQRDSRIDGEPTLEQEQSWALFPVTRLRPEQVAGCMLQASRLKTLDREGSFLMLLQKYTETNDFVKRYGDIGEDEFDLGAVTITQRLLMLNGNIVAEHTAENPIINACTHIHMFAKDDGQAIDTSYLAILNRYPTAREREAFLERLQEGPRKKAIEDMHWTLLNSSELAWNH